MRRKDKGMEVTKENGCLTRLGAVTCGVRAGVRDAYFQVRPGVNPTRNALYLSVYPPAIP